MGGTAKLGNNNWVNIPNQKDESRSSILVTDSSGDEENSKSSIKKKKKKGTMSNLRGQLRKARKQIAFCAFPLKRRSSKKMSKKMKKKMEMMEHEEDEYDKNSCYESALDIPSSYGYEQRRSEESQKEKNGKTNGNPSEVGQTCRGSVNLQEARILSDKATNSIVISAASQTFHVKAMNDADRQQWINSLEYSRHKAIKRAESEEDEDAQLSVADISRSDALAHSNKQLAMKLVDLKAAAKIMNKQGDELLRGLADGSSYDRQVLSERADLLKITTAAVLQAAEEFVEYSEQGAKKLNKIVAVEQKEKLLLQDQLEQLAKQHSSLERAATFCSSEGRSGAPVSAYSDQEDEFHDAEEGPIPCDSGDYSCGDSSTILSAAMTTSSGSESSKHANSGEASSSSTPSNRPHNSKKGRVRRTTVPERPDLPINLWSVMKNCIGKELSKIPMPVNFSEPISVLQRVTEDLEYADILEKATKLSSLEQMCYVAAYAASNYSTTCHRTNKPFNPLLGETFECDRTDDLGWKSITEQVSHHPPAAAHHAEGNGWVMYQDFTMTSRFRGKYLSVIPVGYTHVLFNESKSHFSYKKITTTVHNIIVGKLWIDNHGDMEITNHTTGEKCLLKFIPYSYFSRDTPRKVYGIVRDAQGIPKYVVQGTWDRSIDMIDVASWNQNMEKPKVEVDEKTLRRIWTVHPLPKGAEKMHNFTKLTIELNEPEDGVAPTDSRNRPDQRLMEIGKWDESNKKKIEIEEKQRAVRRRREAEMEKAMQRGEHYEEYQPTWFVKVQDEKNGALIHQYKGGYWEAKEKNNWEKCPDIF